jgi:hypothetical protein
MPAARPRSASGKTFVITTASTGKGDGTLEGLVLLAQDVILCRHRSGRDQVKG